MVCARILAKTTTCVQPTRAVPNSVYVMTALMIVPASVDITNPLRKTNAFVTRGVTGKMNDGVVKGMNESLNDHYI
jgi:hypothetical protein